MAARRPPLPNDLTAKTPAFVGLRNVQRPERLPYGALAVGENVDIDDTGTLETRGGYERVLSFTHATDFFAPQHSDFALVLDSGVLSCITPDLGLQPVVTGLLEAQYQWAELGDRVFFAGDFEAGIVVNGLNFLPLRHVPPLQPRVYLAAGGENSAGLYQVRLVYRHLESGMQSPASRPLQVAVPEDYTLLVEADPRSGYEIDVYVSEANGTLPYLQGSYAGGSFAVQAVFGAQALDSLQRDTYPIPTGITALCCHDGLLFAATYSAADDVGLVWFSLPFHPHLFRLAKDFVALPGKVHGMATTDQGLLIGTSGNIWLRNTEGMQELAAYGVVEGRPFATDKDGTVAFWTARGPATFPPYKLLSEGKVSVPPGSACSTAILDRHGLKQFIALTDSDGQAFNPYTS